MNGPAGGRPRLVVHDYSGHPFQVQLSRELAHRGYDVLHLHCSSYRTGKGSLEKRSDDAGSFHVEGIELNGRLEKYSASKRLLQEREYAKRLFERIEAFSPEVVVSSNNPLFSQQILVSDCERAGIGFVFWQQDLYSVAMKRIAERRLPVAGSAVGRSFVRLERRLLQRSDAVVAIAEDFRPTLLRWGVAPDRVWVVENWAPLAELPVISRDNAWAREHALVEKRVILYSGTLGLKHNPELLLRLARSFRGRPDVRVVVISEGPGWQWLRRRALEERLENLLTFDYQPYARFPEVLATGDVLAVILEADAGSFSVPSKVLSYHCAGRPLLGALPRANLAARVIRRADSGIVVDPNDVRGLTVAAERLLDDSDVRERFGERARRYAEQTFDIGSIGDRFEEVVQAVSSNAGVVISRNGGVRVP